MNSVTLCNLCSPACHGVTSITEMKKHLETTHKLKVKSDYDLLDYYTKWDDEKSTFNYIGIGVKIPNRVEILIMQNMVLQDAKRHALAIVRSRQSRNINARIMIVRKKSNPMTEDDMLLTRKEFNEKINQMAAQRSHTQTLSENSGVTTC